MREISPVLNKLEEMSETMQFSCRKFVEKYCGVVEFLLPDYETSVLLENDEKKREDKLIFKGKKTHELIENYKKLLAHHPVLAVQEEIRKEKREIQAFD